MNWSTIELGSAIVCACLPTYGPLIRIIAESFESLQTWCTSKLSTLGISRDSSSVRFFTRRRLERASAFEELEDRNSTKAGYGHNGNIGVYDHSKVLAYPLNFVEREMSNEHV